MFEKQARQLLRTGANDHQILLFACFFLQLPKNMTTTIETTVSIAMSIKSIIGPALDHTRGHLSNPALSHIPRTNMQGDVWDQIQQDNAYLVDRHPRVVKHIKLVHRKVKPSAVKLIHRIVCEHKEQEPD
jgi:hypothetical protein